jgi:hypothetical protein
MNVREAVEMHLQTEVFDARDALMQLRTGASNCCGSNPCREFGRVRR